MEQLDLVVWWQIDSNILFLLAYIFNSFAEAGGGFLIASFDVYHLWNDYDYMLSCSGEQIISDGIDFAEQKWQVLLCIRVESGKTSPIMSVCNATAINTSVITGVL